MSVLSNHINELKAAEAFSRQSTVFDQLYGSDATIQYKRQRVREHILDYLRPGSSMLELNCGSGEDAVFFAQKGFSVHATDISTGMLDVMKEKIKGSPLSQKINIEQCSFTELGSLQNRGPYDHVYSNFGGLNCTDELDTVLHSIDPLLKPSGVATLVIISKFCLWETLLVFKGKFKTAFRRFFSKNGRTAHVEGGFFKCWYYSPAYVKKHLKEFDVLNVEGLCAIVPPSYIEHFAEKRPRLFASLCAKENKLKSKWPWKYTGDYFIISLRKKNYPAV
jgi:ubiquinone/menaquinone biosynthesis C-methylase UbiE